MPKRSASLRSTAGRSSHTPYDDARIIAGQGTLGLEIAAQAPDVGVVVMPIGEGGLAAGVEALRPNHPHRVQASAMASAIQSHGRTTPQRVETVRTLADGRALEHGLAGAGRYLSIVAIVPDRPEGTSRACYGWRPPKGSTYLTYGTVAARPRYRPGRWKSSCWWNTQRC